MELTPNLLIDNISLNTIHSPDSFYIKTLSKLDSSEYDCYVRNCRVRTKFIVPKGSPKGVIQGSTNMYYLVDDLLCLSLFNTLNVSDQKKALTNELWEKFRMSDELFHSAYEKFSPDFVLTPIRGSSEQRPHIFFSMIQPLVVLFVGFIKNELKSIEMSGTLQSIMNASIDCKSPCCKEGMKVEEKRRDYKIRRIKKLDKIQNLIDHLVIVHNLADKPSLKCEEKPSLLERAKMILEKLKHW